MSNISRLLFWMYFFSFVFSHVVISANQASSQDQRLPAVCENARPQDKSVSSVRKKGDAFFGAAKKQTKDEQQRELIDSLQATQNSEKLQQQLPILVKTVEDERMSDEAKQALMLGVGAKMCVLLRNQIINIIKTINTNVSYWYDQKDHTIRYYLQRSPRHWLSRKTARNEVRDNIAQLECLRDAYFVALHKITQCRDALNEKVSGQEQQQWLAQLMDVCAQIPYIQNTQLIKNTAGQGGQSDSLDRMKAVINLMPEYKRLVAQDLGYAKMPSHLVRNWFGYLAAGLATYCFYQKKDTAVDYVTNLGKKQYKDNIRPLIQEVQKAFLLDKRRSDGKQETQGADKMRDGLDEMGQSRWTKWVPGFGKIKDGANDIIAQADNVVNQASQFTNQARIIFAAAAISPLMVAGYGALKGLKWVGSKLVPKKLWIEYDYKPTRAALLELDRIFSAPKDERAQEVMQGRKLFNLALLKADARHHLHGEQQRSFMTDIDELEKQDKSAQDKLHVIKRMQTTYAFLHPNYKG